MALKIFFENTKSFFDFARSAQKMGLHNLISCVCDAGKVYFEVEAVGNTIVFFDQNVKSNIDTVVIFSLDDVIDVVRFFPQDLTIAHDIDYKFSSSFGTKFSIAGKETLPLQRELPVSFSPIDPVKIKALWSLYKGSEFANVWTDYAYLYISVVGGNVLCSFALPNLCASVTVSNYPFNSSSRVDIGLLKLFLTKGGKLFIGFVKDKIVFKKIIGGIVMHIHCRVDNKSIGDYFFSNFKGPNGGNKLSFDLPKVWNESTKFIVRKNNPAMEIIDGRRKVIASGDVVGHGAIMVASNLFKRTLSLFDTCSCWFNEKYLWVGDDSSVVVMSGIKHKVKWRSEK